MACLAVIGALAVAGILFMTRSAVNSHKSVNYLLVGIALIIALVFFGYFLGSSIYIYMYRPFHYSNLRVRLENADGWKAKFKNRSFQSGWGEDRRILWWITFFSILACIGFLLASVVLFQVSKFYA